MGKKMCGTHNCMIKNLGSWNKPTYIIVLKINSECGCNFLDNTSDISVHK